MEQREKTFCVSISDPGIFIKLQRLGRYYRDMDQAISEAVTLLSNIIEQQTVVVDRIVETVKTNPLLEIKPTKLRTKNKR
jgi:hypothetical protein